MSTHNICFHAEIRKIIQELSSILLLNNSPELSQDVPILSISMVHRMGTVNLLYTDTRYNDKIRYNDNLAGTKPSLKRWNVN